MTRRLVINLAVGMKNVPYIWAGDSPATGFDCSGLVLWIFQNLELLPRKDTTAHGIYSLLLEQGMISPLLPGREWTPLPGDLLFYGHDRISHVAIALDDVIAISATGGGSKTTSREIAERDGAMVKVHKHTYRSDLVAYGSIERLLASNYGG